MGEQEQFKKMLSKVIDETENMQINSSEEIIRTLIDELSKVYPLISKNSAI